MIANAPRKPFVQWPAISPVCNKSALGRSKFTERQRAARVLSGARNEPQQVPPFHVAISRQQKDRGCSD